MLVLTRKANQQIQIGENVVITVLAVKGNSVRLGIEAPREVRVVRGELGPKEVPAAEPVAAEVFDSPEMIVPQGPQAQVSASSRSASASSSSRQSPLETVAVREVRCSPLLRYVAAGAATDAPVARPMASHPRVAGQRTSGAGF
jgi:carbon storage regulator CsrA